MCKEKEIARLLPVVKETIDSVYEYLIPHPDGITMVAKDYGKRGSRVCSKLVNRGIIEKQHFGRGEYRYKWIATMAPTKELYRSIALEIKTEEKRNMDTFRNKAKAERMEEQPAVRFKEMEEMKSLVDQVQEMWERMKSMGCSIENNQIVLTEIKKTVLA